MYWETSNTGVRHILVICKYLSDSETACGKNYRSIKWGVDALGKVNVRKCKACVKVLQKLLDAED